VLALSGFAKNVDKLEIRRPRWYSVQVISKNAITIDLPDEFESLNCEPETEISIPNSAPEISDD